MQNRLGSAGRWGIIPDENNWKLVGKKNQPAFTYLYENETADGVEFP